MGALHIGYCPYKDLLLLSIALLSGWLYGGGPLYTNKSYNSSLTHGYHGEYSSTAYLEPLKYVLMDPSLGDPNIGHMDPTGFYTPWLYFSTGKSLGLWVVSMDLRTLDFCTNEAPNTGYLFMYGRVRLVSYWDPYGKVLKRTPPRGGLHGTVRDPLLVIYSSVVGLGTQMVWESCKGPRRRREVVGLGPLL
ncbi:hypothetical protein G9A89_000374 [Geosiphon pyriformis]|nr:hypothetical protein G9A89_000374 [Geosiphon pyriformis]